MLKIKDDIDLKSNPNFQISDDEYDQIWAYKDLLFDKDTRIIYDYQFSLDLAEKRIDDLYDATQEGLVEKVGKE